MKKIINICFNGFSILVFIFCVIGGIIYLYRECNYSIVNTLLALGIFAIVGILFWFCNRIYIALLKKSKINWQECISLRTIAGGLYITALLLLLSGIMQCTPLYEIQNNNGHINFLCIPFLSNLYFHFGVFIH